MLFPIIHSDLSSSFIISNTVSYDLFLVSCNLGGDEDKLGSAAYIVDMGL